MCVWSYSVLLIFVIDWLCFEALRESDRVCGSGGG